MIALLLRSSTMMVLAKHAQLTISLKHQLELPVNVDKFVTLLNAQLIQLSLKMVVAKNAWSGLNHHLIREYVEQKFAE